MSDLNRSAPLTHLPIHSGVTIRATTMPRILISASYAESLLARQTPGGSGVWGDFQFLFEPDGSPVDGWVICDDLRQPITQVCPPANTLLITGEPPSVRRYRSRYTGQFGQIWTSHSDIAHPYVTVKNESQHWHYGLWSGSIHHRALNFDDLVAMKCPSKTKLLSVICSSKTLTEDHRRRLEFVQHLKAKLGEQVDVFGSGIRPVQDKSEAIWPYQYHIVLENDHSDHFMTEKLPDAFLGWSYPIYFGGPEAYHAFPDGSFTAIDIYRPEVAVKIVQDVIASDLYHASIEHLTRAREIVLHKLNLFAALAEYWQSHLVHQAATEITLFPKSHRASLVLRQIKRSISGRTANRNAA